MIPPEPPAAPVTLGVDFEVALEPIVFLPGESEKTITIRLIDDVLYEGSEQFQIELTNPSGAALGDVRKVYVAIDDDERGFIVFSFDHTVVVSEAAGTSMIGVFRAGGGLPATSVDYAVTAAQNQLSATPGIDFTPISGTLNFAEGERSKTIQVPILNDAVSEDLEWFRVTLSNPKGGTPIAEGSGWIQIGIEDNDPGYSIGGFANLAESESPFSIYEREGEVFIVVRREGDYDFASTVDYRVEPVIGALGLDFEPSSGILIFAAGQTSATIPVRLHENKVIEGAKIFRVILSNPSHGIRLATPDKQFTVLTSAGAQSQWHLRYPLPTPNGLSAVTFTNDQFVAFGDNNTVVTSPDGITWTSTQPENAVPASNPGVDNLVFVSFDIRQNSTDNSQALIALISSNGIAWEEVRVREHWEGSIISRGSGGGAFIGLVERIDGPSGTFTISTLISKDGRIWNEEPATGILPHAEGSYSTVAYGKGMFVLVGNQWGGLGRKLDGFILTSSDDVNWTNRVQMHDATLMGAVGGSNMVAMQNGLLLRSKTGVDWDAKISSDNPPAGDPKGDNLSMAFGSGLFVAPLYENLPGLPAGISTSPDGAQWTPQPQVGYGWKRVRYTSGMFLALGTEDQDANGNEFGKFAFSPDGKVWTTNRFGFLKYLSFLDDVATDGKTFIISTGQGDPSGLNRYSRSLWRSKDGVSWTEVHRNDIDGNLIRGGAFFRVLSFGNGRFVALDQEGSLVSEDGLVWTEHPIPSTQGAPDLIFAAGRFYAIENNFMGQNEARLLSSADGAHWTIHRTGFYQNLRRLSAGPQGLFAFGDNAVILQSPWDVTLKVLEQLRDVGLRIGINGYPGQQVVLESSPTLAPANWQPIATNTLANAVTEFFDATATNSTTRFYRALVR